ncbi:MAG: prephenate dehydratase [Micrococcales bacterium]|nr:prephenate dehydratase [Micrococcales bacterium]
MPDAYSYLGPAGTFTWSALGQVPQARGAEWRSVHNVGEALDDVASGRSRGAVIAVENSVEGGVNATHDALSRIPGIRISGEYLVPVDFDLVARPGTALAEVRVVVAHPVAYAQCHLFLDREIPGHAHLPATSNVAAPASLQESDLAQAAVAPAGIAGRYPLEVLASGIGDNRGAVTRFVLVERAGRVPARTGADKTSLIVDLPDEQAGGLLGLLEQFATRGINMSLLQSRPIGDALGRYRFVIDIDGHIEDERIADALLGVKRFSPRVVFLGSYPRADGHRPEVSSRFTDAAFVEARDWLQGLVSGVPERGK